MSVKDIRGVLRRRLCDQGLQLLRGVGDCSFEARDLVFDTIFRDLGTEKLAFSSNHEQSPANRSAP